MTSRTFDVMEDEDGMLRYEISHNQKVVERFECWDEERFREIAEARATNLMASWFWEVTP